MKTEDYNTSDFARRCEKVAQDFLQSVVVLDDLAWMGPREKPVVVSNELRQPDYDNPTEPSPQTDTDEASTSCTEFREDVPLDAKAVIDGFAELGLVCAVLNPTDPERESSDPIDSNVVKVAKRSDIVVLDWKIGDSYGDDTLDILRQVLDADGPSGRLRLFSIYTGEDGLPDIFQRVKDTVDEFYGSHTLTECGDSCLSKGPVRIIIIPKQGTKTPLITGVPESELADRLVAEFAKMTGGLLCNVALEGLAALRDHAHRVLVKFDASLDAAYLGHRMLLTDPPDAEEHIVEALGAELLSILEDRRPGNEASIDAISKWLIWKVSNGKDLGTLSKVSGITDPVEMRLELLTKGIECVSNPDPPPNQLKRTSTEIFAENAGAAICSKRTFATLLSLKTRYPATMPRLTLGTILRRGMVGKYPEYLLCLQPKCDAIRLSSPTGFPLLPLLTRKVNERFSLIIQEGKGNWVYLDVDTKPRKLTIPSFAPRATSQREIIGYERSNKFFFSDTAGVEYQWIAELKDEHALKIAGQVSANLARPGPNDSEWLRLASKR